MNNLKLDKKDRHIIETRQWFASSHGYAKVTIDGKTEYLHRIIMQPPKGMVVDHINGNKLDCRRKNLRVCTQGENCINKRLRVNNKSGFHGVWWRKERNKWAVQLTIKGKRKCLGHYTHLNDAVEARKLAEEKYYKCFSALKGVLA